MTSETDLDTPELATTGDGVTVARFLESLEASDRSALLSLGRLITGTGFKSKNEDSDEFAIRCLGVDHPSQLICTTLHVNQVKHVCTGLALAEIVDKATDTGPGRDDLNIRWERVSVGDSSFEVPSSVSWFFTKGSEVSEVDVVVVMSDDTFDGGRRLDVFTRTEGKTSGAQLVERLVARGDELNPYRGKILQATRDNYSAFSLRELKLPESTRDDVIVPALIWGELDLSISAVTEHAQLLGGLGLGCRRGALLVGPPGTGKSAVSSVVARELNSKGFTVIYLSGAELGRFLEQTMEAAAILSPSAVVLEDLDLYARDRRGSDPSSLSDVLRAMDTHQDTRIITIASSNDITEMDPASIRSGRFDSVLEIGYPDHGAAVRILQSFLKDVPSDGEIDSSVIAARLPKKTSGADIREIVKRSILKGKGTVSTQTLLDVVSTAEYRPAVPEHGGQYL